MEMVFMVIVVACILWWLGFMRSARKVALMATSEIDFLGVAHKGSIVKRASELKISEEQVSKAAGNLAMLGSLDLFNLPTVGAKAEAQNNG